MRQTHCCGKQTVRASRLVQIVRWWLPRTLASRRIPGGTTCPQFTRCRSAISCLMVTTRSERPSSHAEAARFSSSGLPIPQPHTRWLEWPSAFQVWRSPTENLTLPLFTGGFLRVPLFRFERRGPNSDLLSDMMAIPVSELHFGHLPSIDLTDDPPAPTPGTAVTVYGYPRSPRAPELALRVRDASRGDYSLCRAPSYFRRTNANCGRTFRRSRLRAFGDVRRHDDWPRR